MYSECKALYHRTLKMIYSSVEYFVNIVKGRYSLLLAYSLLNLCNLRKELNIVTRNYLGCYKNMADFSFLSVRAFVWMTDGNRFVFQIYHSHELLYFSIIYKLYRRQSRVIYCSGKYEFVLKF
jgi:hypothetical protein